MTTEITKHQTGGLAVLPDHLKNVHSGEGLENVGREDLVLPRLSICQSMTPQRKKTSPNFIEGLSDGDLFNTVTNEIYGSTKEIIPLLFAKSRIYFRDPKDGGGILCQSFNGIDGGSIAPLCADCPNSKFSKDKPPACTVFMNFPSILVGTKNLVALSLKSTGLKAGKNWLTRMRMSDKPIYSGVYEIKVVETPSAKGPYFSPVISLKRWTTAEEFAFAESQYSALKGRTIATDEVEAETEHSEETPF